MIKEGKFKKKARESIINSLEDIISGSTPPEQVTEKPQEEKIKQKTTKPEKQEQKVRLECQINYSLNEKLRDYVYKNRVSKTEVVIKALQKYIK